MEPVKFSGLYQNDAGTYVEKVHKCLVAARELIEDFPFLCLKFRDCRRRIWELGS